MATRKPPDPRPGDPETSSSRTQRRMLVEGSSDSGSAEDDGGGADAETLPTLSRPQLVVMEEKNLGVADALARMGYLVRQATTGVEAMSLVGQRAPNAVISAPGDPERRRVLVGALRLRFPHVPVVILLPQIDDAARDLARKDGVHAVLTWPLPHRVDVYAAIPGSPAVTTPAQSSSSAPKTRLVPPTAGMPPLPSTSSSPSSVPMDLSADASAEQSAVSSMPVPLPPQFLMPLAEAQASLAPQPTQTLSSNGLDLARLAEAAGRPKGLQKMTELPAEPVQSDTLVRIEIPQTSEGEMAPTAPGRPAASLEGLDAQSLKDVLSALAPLLWGLDDCARYLDDLHVHHVGGADVHARTVRRAASLLAHLHERSNSME